MSDPIWKVRQKELVAFYKSHHFDKRVKFRHTTLFKMNLPIAEVTIPKKYGDRESEFCRIINYHETDPRIYEQELNFIKSYLKKKNLIWERKEAYSSCKQEKKRVTMEQLQQLKRETEQLNMRFKSPCSKKKS